ncbi:unnamed protein product [Pedinophyceae sp. YPF-701]|nr:unnamed protein product [Pedinophyceae sp. YPF-701]
MWATLALAARAEAREKEENAEAPFQVTSTSRAPANAVDLLQMALFRSSSASTLSKAITTPIVTLIALLSATKAIELGIQLLGLAVGKGARSAAARPTIAMDVANAIVSGLATAHSVLVVATNVSVIGLIAWAVLRWKNTVMLEVEQAMNYADDGGPVVAFGSLLVGLSGLVSWLVVGSAVLGSLSVMNVDIRPLLALGGVSGLVAGFAAQSVLVNTLAGVQIFLTRPFAVGERLELRTGGGGKVVSGVVVSIEPTRTIIRGDDGFPISMSNRAFNDMLVINHSRAMNSWGPLGPPPRPLQLVIPIRITDAEHAEKIGHDMREALRRNPLVDHRQKVTASYSGFTDFGKCHFTLRCVSTRLGAVRYQQLKDSVLNSFVEACKKYDATLA